MFSMLPPDYLKLAADDRVDALGLAGLEKVQGAEEVPRVADSYSAHTHGFGLGHQGFDPDRGFQEAVIAVHVKVDKIRHAFNVMEKCKLQKRVNSRMAQNCVRNGF
jgi:hypothetical protein